jgi:type I restriction-modification system DNA methylase subunit
MADGLRNNMDAAEYKHVVLGLIFLKYISDAFEAKHAELESQKEQGADPEDPDEEPFPEKMKRLTATLRQQKAEAAKLDAAIGGASIAAGNIPRCLTGAG